MRCPKAGKPCDWRAGGCCGASTSVTEHFRSSSERETNTSRWLRSRWQYGTVYVIDVDNIVCSLDLVRGLMIEWKYIAAKDKTWRITQYLAEKANWHAALFVYETVDDTPSGDISRITATWKWEGGTHSYDPLEPDVFDAWVCGLLGAHPPMAEAA